MSSLVTVIICSFAAGETFGAMVLCVAQRRWWHLVWISAAFLLMATFVFIKYIELAVK